MVFMPRPKIKGWGVVISQKHDLQSTSLGFSNLFFVQCKVNAALKLWSWSQARQLGLGQSFLF